MIALMAKPVRTIDGDAQAVVQFALRHVRVRTFVCSRQVFETGYELPERTVSDYNFIYVWRGQVVWVIDGVDHRMEPGTLVLVPPHVLHRGYSISKRMALGSIHVEATLPGGQDLFSLLQPPRSQVLPIGCRLDRYFRGAMKEFDRGEELALSLQPFWAELVVREMLRHCASQKTLKPRNLDTVVSGLLDGFRARLDRPVALRELAAQAGFSAQHLNRLFQRALGVTPLQCLTAMRMEKAAELLRDGKLSVAAIAERCGYNDPYYFSRQFSRHWGRSPTAYRGSDGPPSPA
jgi:AraC-like DNA-binding protein/quercetin dioxygenase-like cupin family protein